MYCSISNTQRNTFFFFHRRLIQANPDSPAMLHSQNPPGSELIIIHSAREEELDAYRTHTHTLILSCFIQTAFPPFS